MIEKKFKNYLSGLQHDIEIDEEEPVFTVSVASKLLGIPSWIIKKFDRENLVSPHRIKGRNRLYSKNDLKIIKCFWKFMKFEKMKIGGLKVIKEIFYEEFSKLEKPRRRDNIKSSKRR